MTQMMTIANTREMAHDLNEATIESLEANERGKHLREAQLSTYCVWQLDWLVTSDQTQPSLHGFGVFTAPWVCCSLVLLTCHLHRRPLPQAHYTRPHYLFVIFRQREWKHAA